MRSLPESRLLAEWGMRAIGLGSLLVLLFASLRTNHVRREADVDTDRIADQLLSLSRNPQPPARVHARLSSLPDPTTLDWLRAFQRAGTRVSWSGDDLPALALSVRPVAGPGRGWNVDIASSHEGVVQLRDAASNLDSTRPSAGISRSTVPILSGYVHATTAGSMVSALPRDSALLKRVLMIGAPGWESRFIVAALEEAGWPVDAEIPLAPGVRIQQKRVFPLDTSHYSAVVAVDAYAAARAREISRFAQHGGGVILTADAARQPAFAELRASRSPPGTVVSSPDQGQAVSLASLPHAPLGGLKSDAIVLETRGRIPMVAARRHVAGRVVQISYEDSWKWRTAGDSAAPRLHRLWWTGLVSKVAYAPRIRLVTDRDGLFDDAPMASLHESMGQPASRPGAAAAGLFASRDLRWLFAVACVAFLLEWASRRLRGVR